MAGLLDTLNNPLMGLAAGLLSARAPGGTFGGGLSQGLNNMMGMQQAALSGGLLKAKLDEIEQAKKERENWTKAVGTPGINPTPYQMSDAELFPGEQPIQGLLNAGTPGTGMYQSDPGVAGLLSMVGPEQGKAFLANAALQKMKGVDQTANIQDYQFLIQQGFTPEQAMERVFKQSNSGADPYYQFLPAVGPDGKPTYLVGNARTGSMVPGSVGGAAYAPAQYSPGLQGDIAGAKVGGEATAKRDVGMAGIGSLIGRARAVLSGEADPTTGEKYEKPTSSGFGSVVDAGAGLIGKSPRGAKEADQLRVISGALVTKMPRMEGPQSNFDVQNYKEMAGQVGDATLPIERRLAALAEVERLWAKYDKSQPASTQPAPSGGPKFLGFEN